MVVINTASAAGNKAPTNREIENSLQLAGEYLVKATKNDGEFIYLYDAETDIEDDSYNMVRHAGTVYAMFELYEWNKDEKVKEAGTRALGYLVEHIKTCTRGPRNAVCLIDGGEIRLGGNALAIVALAKYQEATGDTQYLATMQSLARWMVWAQARNGEFRIHTLLSTGRTKNFISEYYPGEATLAFLRLYELDNDKKWLDAADRAARWLITVRDVGKDADTLPHDHWLLYALNELYTFRPDPLFKDHAIKIAIAIVDFQWNLPPKEHPDWMGGYYTPPVSTPTATRTEGLVAAYQLAKKANLDASFLEILRGAIERGLTFELKTQITPQKSLSFKDSRQARGGFMEDLDEASVRIDYVQHNISALLGYLKMK